MLSFYARSMLTLTWGAFLTCFSNLFVLSGFKMFYFDKKNDDGDVIKYDDELIVLIIITYYYY